MFYRIWLDWLALGPSTVAVAPPSIQSGENDMPAVSRPTDDPWTTVYQSHITFARPFSTVPFVKATSRSPEQYTGRSASVRAIDVLNVTPTGFDLQIAGAYTDSYSDDIFDWIAIENQSVLPPPQ